MSTYYDNCLLLQHWFVSISRLIYFISVYAFFSIIKWTVVLWSRRYIWVKSVAAWSNCNLLTFANEIRHNFRVMILASRTDPISLLIFCYWWCSCWGDAIQKRPKAPSFQIGSGWNFQGPSNKYALIDWVGFLMQCHTFKVAMTSTRRWLLHTQQHPPTVR